VWALQLTRQHAIQSRPARDARSVREIPCDAAHRDLDATSRGIVRAGALVAPANCSRLRSSR
jgi:hypothetical protein